MSEVIVEILGDAKLVVYSKIGENHLKNNIENQDAYEYRRDENGNYALIVADGVSSCQNSKTGAELACKTVCNLLPVIASKTEYEIKELVFSSWKKNLNGQWDDFGTTLNFFYLIGEKILIGKIGDGAIITKIGAEHYVIADNNDFHSSETFAFGEKLPKEAFYLKSFEIKNESVYAILMTDGIFNELEEKHIENFTNYVISNIENEHFVIELEEWFENLDKRNGDDKTIMIYKLEKKNG